MDPSPVGGATIGLAVLVVLAGCTVAIGDATESSSPTWTTVGDDEPGAAATATTVGGGTPSPTTGSSPSASATESPTGSPADSPTDSPTESPTASSTDSPTAGPTDSPTATSTASPTATSTASPTASPTAVQTRSPEPSPTPDEPTDRERFLQELAERGIEARYLEDHPDDDGDSWVIAYDSAVDDGDSARWSAMAEEARAVTHAYCEVVDGGQGRVLVWPTGHHSFQIDAQLCWKWEHGTLDGGEVDVMAVVMGSMQPYPASADPYSGRAE